MDNLNNSYGAQLQNSNVKMPLNPSSQTVINDRSKTFIPKGHYDQSNKLYRNPAADASTLSVNRTNEFNRISTGFGTYENVEPINMMHSNQTFQPKPSNEQIVPQLSGLASYTVRNNIDNTGQSYRLGDPYMPPSGTNLGGYDKPVHSYTAYDVLEDDVTDLFKKLDKADW